MVDEPEDKPTSTPSKPNDDDMEQDISDLKREIANLKAAIAERAQDVMGGVEGLYDSAAERASRATQTLRAQAGVVRENPGTGLVCFVVGGIIGMLIGMALGPSEPSHRKWYDRH